MSTLMLLEFQQFCSQKPDSASFLLFEKKASFRGVFFISGKRQVEMFADAIEASANDQTPPIKVDAPFLFQGYCLVNLQGGIFLCKKRKIFP